MEIDERKLLSIGEHAALESICLQFCKNNVIEITQVIEIVLFYNFTFEFCFECS